MSTSTLNKYTIDTTLLDQDTYYPVVMSISSVFNARIEVIVALDSGSKPNWSTHPNGFSCRFIEEVNGSGWSTNYVNRTIYASDYSWTNNSINPIGGVGQLTKSSHEFIYVRGGGKYHFYLSDKIVPVLIKDTFTLHNESVAPTKTPSFNNVRTNLLSTDNNIIDTNIANSVVGKNLILNSNFQTIGHWKIYASPYNNKYTINPDTSSATVTFNNTSNKEIFLSNDLQFKQGAEYILSADIRSNDFTTLNYNYIISLQNGNQVIPIITGITPQWKRFTIKFTPTVNRFGSIGFGITGLSTIVGSKSFQLRNVKLETGVSSNTIYTPNFGDSTYEEGTWTPVVEGSITQGVAQYTVNNARYVRTGNMITVFFNTSGKFTTTPAGTCVIKGLPYQGDSNANGLLTLGIGYAEQNVYFNIEGNTLVSKKQNGKNSGIVPALFGTDLNNTNFHLYGNVSYFIA